MKKWFIEKLGGFPTINSAIEHIREIDDKEKKQEILSLALKKLHPPLDKNKILGQNAKGQWVHKGIVLEEAEVKNLRNEVEILLNMRLWKVLYEDMTYHAYKTLITDSKSMDDVLAGKLILIIRDMLVTRLNKLRK